MTEEAAKKNPNAETLEQISDALEQEFVSRFAGLESEITVEAREFMTLLYRNGIADGLRVAITMLNEAENYNPKYEDYPEMSKIALAAIWSQAAEPLTSLAEGLLEKVKASYIVDEKDNG